MDSSCHGRKILSGPVLLLLTCTGRHDAGSCKPASLGLPPSFWPYFDVSEI